jgi:hypothetical protein
MAVQVLTNLFVIVIVYNVTQRERDTREEEKQGQRMMMIYVSRSFSAEVGERRDKDTREKFQRSLRTTQHKQQTRAFTLVVRSHRFGSSSLIFYLNSTTNSTIIYTYSFSDERFSLSCDLSLNRLSKVSSVPFKTTRASFRFSRNSPWLFDDAKERSVSVLL